MKTYRVKGSNTWYECSKASELARGFLHYELSDGTIGISAPGNWEKVDLTISDKELKFRLRAMNENYLRGKLS